MTTDRFFEALRGMQQQSRRFAAPSEEVLQEFRRVTESLALAEAASQVQRGLVYYAYPSWRVANLLSWWRLHSVCRARDVHGGYNGTLNGDVAFASEDDLTLGRPRRYATFDGTGDYVDVGDITELDGAATVTWAARVYTINTSGTPTIMSRYEGAELQFRIVVNTGITIDLGGAPVGITGALISPNTWYTIAVVLDGGQTGNSNRLKVYLNGVSQALTHPNAVPASLVAATVGVDIGRQSSGINYFSGRIYDVAIWQAALSAAEALAWHNDAISDRAIAGEFKAS